jgi:hypothetical protein
MNELVSEVSQTLHRPTAIADGKGGIVDASKKKESGQEKISEKKEALTH